MLPRGSYITWLVSTIGNLFIKNRLEMYLPFVSLLFDSLKPFRNSFWCENCKDFTPHQSVNSTIFKLKCDQLMLNRNQAYREQISRYNYCPQLMGMNLLAFSGLFLYRGFKCEKCGFVSVHDGRNELIQ